jgi:preprotein translocase subunit SecE
VNRETKRLLQRQGPTADAARPVVERPPVEEEQRGFGARVGEYFREVRNELVKVAWPPRSEVVNYSAVVLVTLIVIVLLIFVLNWAFGHAVIWLFHRPGS